MTGVSETADKHTGSWWQDWARWSAANAGELIDPLPLGSDSFPVLAPGPGRYILT
jgi:polyhydroxyalkanoate synthase subunit PhaC